MVGTFVPSKVCAVPDTPVLSCETAEEHETPSCIGRAMLLGMIPVFDGTGACSVAFNICVGTGAGTGVCI